MTLLELFEREKCTDEEKEAASKYLVAVRLMEHSEEIKRLLFLLNKINLP